jgi:hypothetical protein
MGTIYRDDPVPIRTTMLTIREISERPSEARYHE